jgi:hypothetical protein
MDDGSAKGRKALGILLLLALQASLFLLSMGALPEISIFCTAPKGPPFGYFGYAHVGFAIAFVAGVSSLFWRRLRSIYIGLFAVSLALLATQAWLVAHDYLHCDMP